MSKHEKGMRLIINKEFEGQLRDMCDNELEYQINETQYPEEYASNIFTMLTLLRKMEYIAMAAGYDIQFEERLKDECQDQDVYDNLLALREAWHKELVTTLQDQHGRMINKAYRPRFVIGNYRDAGYALDAEIDKLNDYLSGFYQYPEYFKEEIAICEKYIAVCAKALDNLYGYYEPKPRTTNAPEEEEEER